jgi:Carboxypeptidase regulatory-like domain
VTLTGDAQSHSQEVRSDENGQFSFANVASGPFELTIVAPGFATQTSSGVLGSGETHMVPPIALTVAANVTDVQVALSRTELAQAQVKDEEKQRVFGVIPNFYVTYDPHPVSLTSKQKFELAWKTTIDPVTFAIVGGIAGVQQAENTFSGYGQGASGYAKRFGAAYADLVSGTFIGSAILPSLLKQDPRYFYKGSGSKESRILYAIANSVICKGDNGHWQPNYSNVLGNLAAGGISNLYYPAQNRNGAGLTFENALIGIGATAAANLVEEFLMRKLTSNVPKHD